LLTAPPPRAGGRTRLQQRQKETSRERLIAAARDAFAEISYAGSAIDDIVKRAGVNRSTFYRHFDSKFAIAKAMFEPFWTQLFAVYGNFVPSDPPSDAEIEAWIRRLVTFYRAHGPYFTTIGQVESLEPEGLRWGETIRLEAMRLLGERLPAFRHATSGTASSKARVRVRLMMIELELCVYDLAFNPEAEWDATIAVLGEDIRRLPSPSHDVASASRAR
jgi:AcrR family transcriptional regulator